MMKRDLKWILIVLASCAGLLITLLVGLYFLVTANSARTPDEIARKVGLSLPAYRITGAEDNMDRTASAWSYYCYELEFEEPLSGSFLRKVAKKKTCLVDGDVYVLEDGSPDSWTCQVRIYPPENRAVLEYTFWDILF